MKRKYKVTAAKKKYKQDGDGFSQPPDLHVNLDIGGGWMQLLLRNELCIKDELHKFYECSRAKGFQEVLDLLFEEVVGDLGSGERRSKKDDENDGEFEMRAMAGAARVFNPLQKAKGGVRQGGRKRWRLTSKERGLCPARDLRAEAWGGEGGGEDRERGPRLVQTIIPKRRARTREGRIWNDR